LACIHAMFKIKPLKIDCILQWVGGGKNGWIPLFYISYLHQIHNRRVETQGQGG
jgi:hypothetical protein